MDFSMINWVAVVIAAVASMVIGFVWYGPLFGKPWIKLMGMSKSDIKRAKSAGMSLQYGVSLIGSLAMAFVLSYFLLFMGTNSLVTAAMVGFWAWLGFVAPIQMTEVLFGGKSLPLFLINTGYQLVNLVAMGAIIGLLG